MKWNTSFTDNHLVNGKRPLILCPLTELFSGKQDFLVDQNSQTEFPNGKCAFYLLVFFTSFRPIDLYHAMLKQKILHG